MLQAKTEEKQKHIADILQNTSTYEFDKNGFYIDDFISYEEMAQIVDYLREETAMTELEKAVEVYIDNPANYLEYQNEWEDLSDVEYVEKAFKAGANWQYEQFEKERLNFEPRLKHCDELTAEQAQIESDFVVQHLKKCNRTPTFIDAIEYGRRLMIDKACDWLNNFYSEDRNAYLVKEDIDAFIKAMEE